MDEMLTVKEVAAYLRVHRSTLYRMIGRGDVPYFKVGYDYRFSSESIERWLAWKAGGEREWNQSESTSSEKPPPSEKK